MDAEDICKDYASSLEDLTFNSKPLINMLTMLAEENSQHAAEIVKLVEKRIYEVSIEKKLPSLYLMDSIVKNIGEDYITAVAPCIVAIFTHVFEQADEKMRISMFKLRNTWPAYFSAKILHELDCSVHKRDPGWPVVGPPPPSPSIHINPKFLSKVEETVEESKSGSSSSDEAKLMEEFERKKKELEQLQGEQMRTQMMQLEELKMKYELIKKKQEKDRQNLLKQQQEQILKMRLQQEEVDSSEETLSDSKLSEASTRVKKSSKDPRIKKLELLIDSKTDTDTSTDNTQDEPEKIEAKPSSRNSENTVENTVDKVGFDLEFVPLDKDEDIMQDTTPTVAYNRDRPLGKNRYFRKDPKAKIFKSDSDSGSDFGDLKHTKSEGREDPRSINRRGKRLRGGKHHIDRQNHQPFKENDRGERETLEERKKSERGRGRARRRHSGDRPGDRINDRPGEPSGDRRFEDRHRIRPGEHLENRPGVRPGGRLGDRPGRRPEDHSVDQSRGRPVERPSDRIDIGKNRRRPPRRIGENDRFEDESLHRRDEWSRGRGQRRLPQSHAVVREETIEGRFSHEFPQPVDNTGRLPERREHEQGFDRPDGMPPYERGEPPFKKSRPSPPRPLFSEREIFEIREKRCDSPGHSDHLPEKWRNNRPGFHEPWRHDGGNIRQAPPEFYNNQFPEGPHLGPRPPHFLPPHDDVRPFGPRDVRGEFLHPPQRFPGDVEIPLELTLDNESEILRSAEHRLRTGELSAEQHHELLEKLRQLYELQKWQRRRSLDMAPQHEPGHPFIPQPALHPHADGRPVMLEQHLINDHNRVLVPEGTVQLGDADMFAHQPPQQMQPGMMIGGEGIPHFSADHMTPDEINPKAEAAVPPSNLVMEKQTVDDLFKRLIDFGIITKVNQGASPARTMTPPIVETQILQQISLPKLPELPEIKLTLDHLRRRYEGVIMQLHCGTQCSSCGLRFKEDDNENYRQHLDWHFRMNRKEKVTLAAHRSWFITTDDWLEFESSEDPKLKARSAVFEAESDGESENSEDVQEGSCPVLMNDTETERACDICFEKFETFWDETSEDWHYKNAVRVDGKTYHYICYQDAKETADSDADGDASDEKENTEDNDDSTTMDGDNDTSSEMQNNDEIQAAIEDCNTNDKPSVVTEDTALGSEVVSVVQGGDDVAVDNTNKEEIITQSS